MFSQKDTHFPREGPGVLGEEAYDQKQARIHASHEKRQASRDQPRESFEQSQDSKVVVPVESDASESDNDNANAELAELERVLAQKKLAAEQDRIAKKASDSGPQDGSGCFQSSSVRQT